jgi:hypothetical protein
MNYGVLCHFQQYFSYFVAVSFIGGENLLQVTDKRYHIFTKCCILLLAMSGILPQNVSGDRP